MNTTADVLSASIEALRGMYEGTSVSPVEVLEATLREVEDREPDLNAVVTVLAESAREQAREAERAFSAGEPTPPLAGMPVSVKDIIAIAGVPMTAGSRILREHQPDWDSAVYQRLRRAGAVVFATTNMLEFAYGFAHPDFGQSNNPWALGRTAGGSSSGSAASVAAGIGVGSVVTDTGGSARLPAAFCGLTGLKPTYGTIDQAGVLPLAPSFDVVGVLTRTVADNREVYRALSDARSTDRPAPRGALRIGVVRDLLEQPLTDQVRAAFDAGLDALRDAGAMVVDVRLPGVRTLAEHAASIMLAEAAHTHLRWYPQRAADYAPGTAANLAAGRGVTAVDYLRALDGRARLGAAVDDAFDDVDVLACPTVGFTAPEREPDFEGGGLDYIVRTIPFSATGHPALTVPAPMLRGRPDLPIGLQLIARKHDESTLHHLAGAYEATLGGFPLPARPTQARPTTMMSKSDPEKSTEGAPCLKPTMSKTSRTQHGASTGNGTKR